MDRRSPLVPIRLPLLEGLGCVLAEVVVATEDVPAFANSAMDGYALLASDTAAAPRELRVVGSTMAGEGPAGKVASGETVRIMTGAPIPEGADAVCMMECTRAGGNGTVVIDRQIAPGQNVRGAGEDVARGIEVFRPGATLSPAHLGVLASLGVQDVLVHPRPRVGVLSTGDELVSGPGPLGPGQVRDSNRIGLLALVENDGFCSVNLGVVGDEDATVTAALLEGLGRCDALLTTGGVSIGDRDVAKIAIEKLAEPGSFVSLQVAVKPARPFAFGEVEPGPIPVFGLPGNPVAAMVAYEIYARPALRKMAGFRRLDRPRLAARADEPFRRRADGKIHFISVVASVDRNGSLHARSAGTQNSHALLTVAEANALAVLPDGVGIDIGDEIRVMPIGAGFPSVANQMPSPNDGVATDGDGFDGTAGVLGGQ
jgi:molybdenum cofactor synthesis domain-containing protein